MAEAMKHHCTTAQFVSLSMLICLYMYGGGALTCLPLIVEWLQTHDLYMGTKFSHIPIIHQCTQSTEFPTTYTRSCGILSQITIWGDKVLADNHVTG